MRQLLIPALFLFGAGAFAANSGPNASPNTGLGIVSASGHFTVQGSEVWGNATLFDGAIVETGAASSQLALRNGVKIQLGARSRARVYADRLTLENGVGQISPAAPFEIDAAGLKIQGSGVRVNLGGQIEIAALAGPARVSSGASVLASIPAGRHMSLSFQAAQSATLTRTGCLLYKESRFILQDENTMEVVELAGQDLAPNLGNRVQVRGTASAAKPAVTLATSVLNVTAVSPQSTGGCLIVASNLNAQTEMPRGAAGKAAAAAGGAAAGTAAGAAAGGLSTGAIVAITAAGAGAAAGAAIALAHGKSSTSP